MFIRYSVRRISGKTYRYPQLVEAYRKPNGAASHRVLCTLTSLSEQTLTNLATALEAGRNGAQVVVSTEAADVLRSVGVLANLRYLDIAVAFEQWRDLGLDVLLGELFAGSEADVPPQDVLCALVLHRCTDPGSKLAAARWYPKTALPELQRIAPSRFHNTRVHRTLEVLERFESELQDRLAEKLCASQGAFATLFMDITDTWFEGRGPQMAYHALTKEKMLRHKIGVLLLCDHRGYPVRWQTLPGDYYEANAMEGLIEKVSTLGWVHQVPLVLDRMMGKAGMLASLCDSTVRFVTALPASEFESWTEEIPWQPLAEVTVVGSKESRKEDLARVTAALKRTGMLKASAERWLLDLGVVTRTDYGDSAQHGRARAVAEALSLALSMKAELDAGIVRSRLELAKREGASIRSIESYLKLTKLVPEIQRRVLAGGAQVLSLQQLGSVAGRKAARQMALFEKLLKASKRIMGPAPRLAKTAAQQGAGLSIRLVAGFNPEAFIDERKQAFDTRREVDAFVDELNRRLSSPQSRRTEQSILGEMDRFLRPKKLLGLFAVSLHKRAKGKFKVTLRLDQEAWAKRRRYDGFTVYAAHPDIPMSAADLVATYIAKDAVEKDFQTIKSELELRPVRHRTDAKVRAHVTICMLALLLERHLELRLRTAGLPMTAPALFDALSSVHLNTLRHGSDTNHTVTQCEPDTTALLGALGMQHLVDDERVSQRILPRASGIS